QVAQGLRFRGGSDGAWAMWTAFYPQIRASLRGILRRSRCFLLIHLAKSVICCGVVTASKFKPIGKDFNALLCHKLLLRGLAAIPRSDTVSRVSLKFSLLFFQTERIVSPCQS